jgi:polyhydroxyalkanoate synthesis regulator phasin
MISAADIYPWLSILALALVVGNTFVRALSKQTIMNQRDGWKESSDAQSATIDALQPRIETLENEVAVLKDAARTDKGTITGLKGERTKLQRRVRDLENYVKLLHDVLRKAGIAAPPLAANDPSDTPPTP